MIIKYLAYHKNRGWYVPYWSTLSSKIPLGFQNKDGNIITDLWLQVTFDSPDWLNKSVNLTIKSNLISENYQSTNKENHIFTKIYNELPTAIYDLRGPLEILEEADYSSQITLGTNFGYNKFLSNIFIEEYFIESKPAFNNTIYLNIRSDQPYMYLATPDGENNYLIFSSTNIVRTNDSLIATPFEINTIVEASEAEEIIQFYNVFWDLNGGTRSDSLPNFGSKTQIEEAINTISKPYHKVKNIIINYNDQNKTCYIKFFWMWDTIKSWDWEWESSDLKWLNLDNIDLSKLSINVLDINSSIIYKNKIITLKAEIKNTSTSSINEKCILNSNLIKLKCDNGDWLLAHLHSIKKTSTENNYLIKIFLDEDSYDDIYNDWGNDFQLELCYGIFITPSNNTIKLPVNSLEGKRVQYYWQKTSENKYIYFSPHIEYSYTNLTANNTTFTPVYFSTNKIAGVDEEVSPWPFFAKIKENQWQAINNINFNKDGGWI